MHIQCILYTCVYAYIVYIIHVRICKYMNRVKFGSNLTGKWLFIHRQTQNTMNFLYMHRQLYHQYNYNHQDRQFVSWILSLACGLFQEMPKYQHIQQPKTQILFNNDKKHNFLKKEALDTVRNGKLSSTKQSWLIISKRWQLITIHISSCTNSKSP